MLEEVAHEFGEVEAFLAAAEQITGEPYAWGVCDLLCQLRSRHEHARVLRSVL